MNWDAIGAVGDLVSGLGVIVTLPCRCERTPCFSGVRNQTLQWANSLRFGMRS